MEPDRCNSSGSKYLSSLLPRGINSHETPTLVVGDSLATIFNSYFTQNIAHRSATKTPEHRERREAVGSLPQSKGHERPFCRRKGKAAKCDERLEEHGSAFRAHAHVDA